MHGRRSPNRRLSKDLAASEEALDRAGVIGPHAVDRVRRRNLLSTEPPDHTRLRRIVKRAFSPRRVAGLRPRVDEITYELLDAIAPAGKAERPAGLTSDGTAVRFRASSDAAHAIVLETPKMGLPAKLRVTLDVRLDRAAHVYLEDQPLPLTWRSVTRHRDRPS